MESDSIRDAHDKGLISYQREDYHHLEIRRLAGEVKFLEDLKAMVCEKGLEYFAPWEQVPPKWKDEFKGWVGEVKQQIWTDMWERGWANYGHEFLAYIITKHLEGRRGIFVYAGNAKDGDLY